MNIYILCDDRPYDGVDPVKHAQRRGYDAFAVVRAASEDDAKRIAKSIDKYRFGGCSIERVGTSPETTEALIFYGYEGGYAADYSRRGR